jgi:Chaperone of endosialidase
MTIVLKVKNGLSAAVVTSIPEQWSAAWFRRFITSYLQNADVRNTVGATGSTFANPPTPAGNATSVGIFTATTPGSVPASGGGATKFINANGNWVVVGASGGSANPSALVGPVAVNGTAITYMTSDSAPGQNLAATYPWTGPHSFSAAVTVTGGLTANLVTSTTFNATSDPKLKRNIEKIRDSGAILDGIHGYRFSWRADNRPTMGVLSTEIKALAPELVGRTDRAETVNYNGLVAVLIEEVKTLRARVAKLERR